jgi:hypothetical protein
MSRESSIGIDARDVLRLSAVEYGQHRGQGFFPATIDDTRLPLRLSMPFNGSGQTGGYGSAAHSAKRSIEFHE